MKAALQHEECAGTDGTSRAAADTGAALLGLTNLARTASCPHEHLRMVL